MIAPLLILVIGGAMYGLGCRAEKYRVKRERQRKQIILDRKIAKKCQK